MNGSTSARALPLLAAAVFVFFILASAPHSVHHVFKPHKTPENCLVYSLAQGCHVAAVSAAALPAAEHAIEYIAPARAIPIVRRAAAPFFQRAPPAA